VLLLRFLFVLSSNLTNERGKKPRAVRLLETALGPVRVSSQASESVTAVIKKSNAWLLKKQTKNLTHLASIW
jgi:hypothetical protein